MFNHELLRARPTTLQLLHYDSDPQLKPIQLPHLTHFATHEGYLLLGCYKSN